MRYLFACVAGLGLAAAALSASRGSAVRRHHRHQVQPRRGARYPQGPGGRGFKELAEQITAGAVKVQVYPNSELYKDKEELEALQLGAVQMLAPSLAKFGALGVKEYEAFDLPYIFPDKTRCTK